MPEDRPQPPQPPRPLLDARVGVVNIGLASFAEDLRSRGVPVVHVDWSTARVPDPKLAALLDTLGT